MLSGVIGNACAGICQVVLSISISGEAEATLRAKAAMAGVDPASYVSTLVEQSAVGRIPSIAEISGPIAEEFEASGMTEEELADILEDAKHAMRAERRARQAS